MTQELSHGPRFDRLRRLGSGSMGAVWEAYDRVRKTTVALKVLHAVDSEAIYRFKKEFRALADVAHPNLVAFHELLSEGDDWLLSMELVDGVDIIRYVGGDLDRLRAALAQLVDGLSVLHAADLVHRDVKPSNVMVDSDGRVVLLDFGLVAQLRRSIDPEEGDAILGTAAYIAPEQIQEPNVTPAADWYSVGVILFQALAGRTPFTGSPLEILIAKEQRDPPPVRSMAPDAPAELAELCDRLLARDPAARPDGDAILETLGVGPRPSSDAAGDADLIGRDHQLEELDRAFERVSGGRGMTVFLTGRSGMGKSALLRAYSRRVSQRGALVLRGRCLERESVPYKGFDSLVDDLAQHLAGRAADEVTELLPEGIADLARLFPVLRRVEPIAACRDVTVADPFEVRRRAAGALRALLGALSARHPAVVAIDDLHWSDADSAVLLSELTRPPDAPALLLVATLRTDDAAPLDRIRRAALGEVRRIAVDALDPTSGRRLAARLLGHGEADASDEEVDAVAWEGQGNPLFIHELANFVAAGRGLARSGDEPSITLEQVMIARFEGLHPSARSLLDAVAVAGGPIELRHALRAATLEDDPSRAIEMLRSNNLIHGRPLRPTDRIELLHDRIREAALSHLDDAAKRACHARLAASLATAARPDAEAIAHHWSEAGDREQASGYLKLAAGRAAEAFAFDRAAELYQRYLASPSLSDRDRHRALVARADALADAGRGSEAGDCYLEAVETAPDQTVATELERRAAEQLLRSGRIDRGMEVVREALANVGARLPASPRSALASVLYQRARLRLRGLGFRARDARDIPAAQLHEIDTLWSAATGLAMVDPIRAVALQARGARAALTAGERYRVVRSLVGEAMIVGTAGTRAGNRAEQIAGDAEALAEQIGDVHARGLARMARAYVALLRGHWAEAVKHSKPAIGLFRNYCPGAWWELASTRHIMIWSLAYTGAIDELPRRVLPALREAESRGDLYVATMSATGLLAWAWLARDRSDEAREQITAAADRWAAVDALSESDFHIQHYNQMLAAVELELYVGAHKRARARILADWPALEASLLLRTQQMRIEGRALRARTALAAATTGNRALLGEAAGLARKLRGEGALWAEALADLIDAAVARRQGRIDAAVELLRDLPARFDQADMRGHARVARIRLGQLLGGDEGDDLIAEATEELMTRGVAEPSRWCDLIAPGF